MPKDSLGKELLSHLQGHHSQLKWRFLGQPHRKLVLSSFLSCEWRCGLNLKLMSTQE